MASTYDPAVDLIEGLRTDPAIRGSVDELLGPAA
jgi:hypothetical protein